jgi:hypothetical protein
MSRKLLGALVGALLLILGGAISWAAIPHSSTGTITGCYSNANGVLRVIDAEAGASCSGNETQIEWNQPQFSGLVQAQSTWSGSLLPGDGSVVNTFCPSGKEPISGGYRVTLAPQIQITRTLREGSVTPYWATYFKNVSGSTVSGSVFGYAICASIG